MSTSVMIVEDEVVVARSLNLTLTKFGYEVLDLATSYDDAVREAGEKHPDVVLMDIVLHGGKDGIDAAKEIGERYHIPVIYLTAYADEETVRRAQMTDPLGYIIKPFEANDVHTTIEIGLHRHRVEEKLKGELEDKVRERTEQLQDVNQELESFSYSISHDLRAPLRAIKSFVAMLVEEYSGQLDAEAKRQFGVIVQNVQLMATLLDELLAFSRLNRQEIQSFPINMTDLVSSVVNELQRSEPSDRRIVVTIHDLPPANGSEILLRQAITNLVANALKFTRHRTVTKIDLAGFETAKQNVYYIRDNGVGFDMHYVKKLFGVFKRLHSDEEFEGVGVGLAIVKRIIVRHGGKVWAEGEVGKGATFYFTLPKS